MFEDDEKTRLRRSPAIDDHTRARSEPGDKTELRRERPAPAAPAAPVGADGAAGPHDPAARVAHVPGSTPDHPVYRVRRDEQPAPDFSAVPDSSAAGALPPAGTAPPVSPRSVHPASRNPGRSGSRGRSPWTLPLTVTLLAMILVAATVLLAVLVLS